MFTVLVNKIKGKKEEGKQLLYLLNNRAEIEVKNSVILH
jgi:hypothetical protein